jgi:D-alanyl-D-alanine endopeptidase (penicillin-binding protein 7)
MNDKAITVKMTNTIFVEPTGLLNENVSTAEDLIKLVVAASTYPVITEDSNSKTVKVPATTQKHIEFRNTNTLVGNEFDFIVSKTGFIKRAGGCIVMMVRTNNGIRTVVVLGSKNTKTRIPEAKLLAQAY